MTSTTPTMTGAPTGWYADPADPGRLRKWDGRSWTDSWMTRPAGWTAARRPRPVAAGWYPDPGHALRGRWWNGASWTARVRPGRLAPGRTPLTPGFFRLARVLQVLLVVEGVLLAVRALAALWYFSFVRGVVTDPAAHPDTEVLRADLLWAAVTLPQRLALLATAVCFVVWLWKAHGSDRVDPDLLGQDRIWVVLGWFVPILFFVRPYAVVADVRRAAVAAVDGRPPAGRGVVLSWWLALICGWVLSGISEYQAEAAADRADVAVQALVTAQWTFIAAALAGAVTAALAVAMVREITATLYGTETEAPLPAAEAAPG